MATSTSSNGHAAYSIHCLHPRIGEHPEHDEVPITLVGLSEIPLGARGRGTGQGGRGRLPLRQATTDPHINLQQNEPIQQIQAIQYINQQRQVQQLYAQGYTPSVDGPIIKQDQKRPSKRKQTQAKPSRSNSTHMSRSSISG